LRPDLLRFARLQLRDAGAAEDAVQETLLAALTGSQRFESRSSYKTWLISILRNKIIDIIRSQGREVPASSLADDEDGRGAPIPCSTQRALAQGWRDRRAGRSRGVLRATAVLARVRGLPRPSAGKDGARVHDARIPRPRDREICKETGISTSNCWVVLHRARLGLRTCLEHGGLPARRPEMLSCKTGDRTDVAGAGSPLASPSASACACMC
jgi:RNA polymerase sigma-70 factor (ECF subfamily)